PGARSLGCGFAARCAFVEQGRCTSAPIPLDAVPGDPAHGVRCVRQAELPARSTAHVPMSAAPPREAGTDAVTARGLRKVFDGHQAGAGGRRPPVGALDGVDLAAERGRPLAIVGESGSGKSTFARILAGLEVATDGRLTVAAHEVARLPVERRPRALKR